LFHASGQPGVTFEKLKFNNEQNSNMQSTKKKDDIQIKVAKSAHVLVDKHAHILISPTHYATDC